MTRLRILPVCFVPFLACTAHGDGTATAEVEVSMHSQAFRTGWHGDGHAEITQTALSFLYEDIQDALAEANEAVDGAALCDDTTWLDWFVPECVHTKLRSEYHFDNCRVPEGFASVRGRYTALVESLSPDAPQLEEAEARFGSILHSMQDFYAHSNRVDAGRTEPIAVRGFALPAVVAGSELGGMVVVTDSLPSGVFVQESANPRVPDVWNGVAWKQGLITGTYDDNEDDPICPEAASIEHGDTFYQDEGSGSYLAKDDPDSLNHAQAVDAATLQTAEEFCRLVRLVTLRHGYGARQQLLDAWVSDLRAYNGACPGDLSLVTAVFMTAI